LDRSIGRTHIQAADRIFDRAARITKMSTISTTITATPTTGLFGKVIARVGDAWAARRASAAFAGMSEREFQDVGWGQTDRYPHELGAFDSPPERPARLIAQAAWFAPNRRAA
jgi:hypothetical protein